VQAKSLSALLTVVGLTFTSVWPVTVCAETFDIPEVGVRLPNLPAGTSKPQVSAHVDGYSAGLHVGTATLSIARVEEPVPAGSDVADGSYRTAQQASFNEDLGPKVHSEATSVNDHPAWTNGE
jgi:hypothetical protein